MTDAPKSSASPGYALGRLLLAVDAAASHPDPEVRRRSAARVEQWRAVLEGMGSGRLSVGSRAPVADTPVWVTLEVVHGGFATGRFLAEGPLEPHEEAMLASLPADAPGDTPRERLNLWLLGDAGQRLLLEAIRAGRFTVTLPEEGALPVLSWLLEAGEEAEALDLLAQLRPYLARLRFYPRLEATPRPASSVVRVATVGEVAEGLRAAGSQRHVEAMNEALRVWNPLFDRLVALWLDTVDGEPPGFARGDDDAILRGPGDQPVVVGGWPCRRWPAEWAALRDRWISDYKEAARRHGLCQRHRDGKSGFSRLREALERAPRGSDALSGRDVARIRGVLAGVVARGAPGSPVHQARRAAQAVDAARPSNADVAGILARRLDAYPANGGLPALDPIAGPVAEGEGLGVPPGTPIPPHMLAKATRALEAPIAELVERGVIGSAEVLAIVLPQITSGIAAAGIADPDLRGLYSQIYAAFRRRRSLLLLDLEHQVRFDELPWVAALAPLRRGGLDERARARQTLEEVTLLALSAFPETILPNPLVREIGALCKAAGLQLPLVEEVAADIFMGTFTAKWAEAAQVASMVLEGTLYARYYDLPKADDPALASPEEPPAGRGRRWSKPTAEPFAALCRDRAREAGRAGGSRVAQNGAILEQSQILTTHNLAPLASGLRLGPRVQALAPTLARAALAFVVRRQAQVAPDFKSRLQMVKNAAYAWRQAIFFLSFVDLAEQRSAALALAADVAAASDRAWADRFAPAVAGLRHIVDGGRFDADGHGPDLAVRFLGWSVGKHWLL